MANWSSLKAAIANVIKTNGNQEITGALLQNTLNNIVNNLGENATFAGIATPETNPGIPDGPVFYLAAQRGEYPNFNVINKYGPLVIYNVGKNWLSNNLLEEKEYTVLNINALEKEAQKEYTLKEAISLVPAAYRNMGRVIMYRSSKHNSKYVFATMWASSFNLDEIWSDTRYWNIYDREKIHIISVECRLFSDVLKQIPNEYVNIKDIIYSLNYNGSQVLMKYNGKGAFNSESSWDVISSSALLTLISSKEKILSNAALDGENLYSIELLRNIFFDMRSGYVYDNAKLDSLYGALISISPNTEYILKNYIPSDFKLVSILDQFGNVIEFRSNRVAYTGSNITIPGDTSWDKCDQITIHTGEKGAYIGINVAENSMFLPIQLNKKSINAEYHKVNINPAYVRRDSEIATLGIDTIKLNKHGGALAFMKSGMSNSKNLFSIEDTIPYFFDTRSGLLYGYSSEAVGFKCAIIKVESKKSYVLSGLTFKNNGSKLVSILDQFGNVIEFRSNRVAYTGSNISTLGEEAFDTADILISVPQDGAFIGFNVSTNEEPLYYLNAKIQLELGKVKTSYERGKERNPSLVKKYELESLLPLPSQPEINSHYKGKKIVWFGTSIPATGYDQKRHSDKAYPAIVGTLLGATVVNEAESSSQCRISFVDGVEFDLTHQDLAFAMTKAEKNQRKLSESNSYELKMLKADRIDADLFVFDFGINDAHRDVVGFTEIPKKESDGYNIQGLTDDKVLRNVGSSPEILPDWQNRKTFIGAMNFVISELVKAKPKARFCIVTHHEGQMDRIHTNTTANNTVVMSKFNSSIVIAAQKKLAEYWACPIFVLSEKTGWSQRIIDGKPVLNYFALDGLHPNQDTTGYSTNLIAKLLANWINTI